jgi:hypothetical protein
MAGRLKHRRSGTDRRHKDPGAAVAQERRRDDRRQFPPPAEPAALSSAACRVQDAIDEYKVQKGAARISVDELLGVLTTLGYRQA